ncbi:MAG: MBOAT family protein [Deltaproteobacteria bacterium]|nr:MBOAT family protein [Deltaproteobacteria bacterium]
MVRNLVFNSYTFVVFFAVVLGLHHLRLPWWTRKLNLLLASYLFYMAWNPPFVLLLWVSTVADWYIARGLQRTEAPGRRRLLLLATLGVNLGLLVFFKYGNFALENFTWLMGSLGVSYSPVALDIVLPVGISFYTFQTLSYTLDVYLRRGKPWHSFLDYALYVTFFPQLVAGPIVRSAQFLPQCVEPRRATAHELGWGLALMVLGLFEKVVLADGFLAPVVEVYYDAAVLPDAAGAWIGTLAFAGQIFCDFAGYSTIAIGSAMCLGFELPDNFRFPYAAMGFSDFWRRWHISLSTWLRDYLYIPLGGNRHGQVRTYVNLSLTMLLGGLWHGASWNFVVWGALHGLYLVLERGLKVLLVNAGWAKSGLALSLGRIGTFVLVCFAWIFFRADTLPRSTGIVAAMVGLGETTAVLPISDAAWLGLGVALGVVALQWAMKDATVETVAARTPWWALAFGLAIMLAGIVMMPGEDRAFIYFQF